MKKIFLIPLVLIVLSVTGQNVETLEKVPKNAKSPLGEAIIYGDFIQRLGFSSGGFPQNMFIKNMETNQFYKYRVKPTYKSRKDNTFCFYLTPGIYIIYSYFWTQSTWYGGNWHGEPIFEGIDVSKCDEGVEIIPSNLIDSDSLRYIFTVKANSINYLGTWHFENGLVSFSNDKDSFDIEIKSSYKKLDFEKAEISIPK